MNVPLYIAKRYLLSKKRQNVVNIISIISIVGVSVGTMGLIIVLSVFNGFENLVISLYDTFDPDISITARQGKVFDSSSIPLYKLNKIQGISHVTEVLEENALFKYKDKQYIGTLKGVSKDFVLSPGMDSMMVAGNLVFEKSDTNYAVLGEGVAYFLGFNMSAMNPSLQVFLPKRGRIDNQHPEDSFIQSGIVISGIFAIQQEFDSKYLLCPLRYIRSLLGFKHEVSALEIHLKSPVYLEETQLALQRLLGKEYNIKNRYQQHEVLYKIMKSEKWAVYLILTFILLIATFNVIGSLTMLIIDKKKDIAILWSLGASNTLIERIFLIEGILISLVGALSGLLSGAFICWLQQHFGFIKLQGSGSFVIDAYPVNMQGMDFLYVFCTVFIIGFFAAWYPTKKVVRRQLNQKIK
jgi:lipoprotein-releasing system permease protein